MHIFTIVKEFTNNVAKGLGLFLFERGGYVEIAYTPGLHHRKK